jgi:acyl carrier protein
MAVRTTVCGSISSPPSTKKSEMSSRSILENRLTTWFLTKLNLEIPSPKTDLLETGILDSLGFVELLVHLEREFSFKITLEDVDIDNFRSVERIAAFLRKNGRDHVEPNLRMIANDSIHS